MNKCIQCTTEYQSKRASSKYCSAQCRKLAFQKKEVSVPKSDEVSVPGVTKGTLTGNANGTLTPKEDVTTERVCKDVHPIDKCLTKEDWQELKDMNSPLNQYARICNTYA